MTKLLKQEGFSLLEVMIALGILGIVGIGFMVGLSGAFRLQDRTIEQVRASNLARGHLEHIRSLAYNPAGYDADMHPPGPFIPQGYSIAVTTSQYCDGLGPDGVPGGASDCYPTSEIQKNTVKVSRDDRVILTVEDLKTKR